MFISKKSLSKKRSATSVKNVAGSSFPNDRQNGVSEKAIEKDETKQQKPKKASAGNNKQKGKTE